MGLRTIAVFSDADHGSPHVTAADMAVRLGPAAASESYLSVERIIAAASAAGADAVHPGYGFLSESPHLARACLDAGITFVGPSPDVIEAMGDKIRARRLASAAGVPVVPGSTGEDLDDSALIRAADEIGYPVLIKPSAGGGGKGMVKAYDPAQLRDGLTAARRIAEAAFGDGTVFIERLIERPRHIEIQIMADSHGTVVHLGDRECSLQRRHQKVIEEAPSPLLTDALRQTIASHAITVAKACDYTNAGTVEFVVNANDADEHHFLEMNTRLQVEHPVTEEITGIDLVEAQIRVAAGERLPFSQYQVKPVGHAFEARVYAEDPVRGFLPTGGTVLALNEPTTSPTRVDSGIRVGTTVTSAYDPLLAKVIVSGPDRGEALRRLRTALAGYELLGFATNTGFVRRILSDPAVVDGNLDTELIERLDAHQRHGPPSVAVAAAALHWMALLESADRHDPWQAAAHWRLGGRQALTWTARDDAGDAHSATVVGSPREATVTVADSGPAPASVEFAGQQLAVTYGDTRHTYLHHWDGEALWLGRHGESWRFMPRHRHERRGDGASSDGQVRSPMPGKVTAVHVDVDDHVDAGQPLVVVEAMKMEHTLLAPADGTVTAVLVTAGEHVRLDQPLVVVAAEKEPRPR